MLHIERLLRSCDETLVSHLEEQVNFTISKNLANNTKFHRLEQLRNSLLTSDDYMKIVNKLSYSNESVDKNKLRQLIVKARDNKKTGNVNYSTELFRYLRDNILNDEVVKELLK